MAKIKLVADVQMRVLVVEDNEELCQAIEHDLTKNSFDVVCVNRGTDAIKMLQSEEFDLVLCDWRLPDLGGLDLLGYVKQQLGTPFVLMTGFSDFIDKQDAYTSGASVFLSKPFNSTTLHAAIAKAMGLEEGTAEPLHELLKRKA